MLHPSRDKRIPGTINTVNASYCIRVRAVLGRGENSLRHVRDPGSKVRLLPWEGENKKKKTQKKTKCTRYYCGAGGDHQQPNRPDTKVPAEYINSNIVSILMCLRAY